MIKDFLDLRNAVAAHGNLTPPFKLMEDQVYEIQYLLNEMISKIAFSVPDNHN